MTNMDTAQAKPSLEEVVARILEPQAWRALGLCDTLAYKNRRTSSLRKAAAVLTALSQASESSRSTSSSISQSGEEK